MVFNLERNPELKMKSDIIFKAFFSKKENEGFLQEFLETILKKKIEIKMVGHDVSLDKLEKDQKYGILDLGVELENGEYINIEIQLRDYHNIEERTTFYASKKISEQIKSGEGYNDLKPVIIIAILDYEFIELPEYVTETVRVAAEHRDYELNNSVKYYYIELSKFRKQNPDMTNPLNQWLSFLDMERGDLLEMASKENKNVKKAMENYEVLTGDAEVKRLAEIRLMSKLEEKSALLTEREAGREVGREEGREEGIKRGRKEGKEEGIKEVAKKLLKEKMPIKKIAEITGLSEKELKELAKEE